MTDRDRAIYLLFMEAIERRDAEAMTALWRRFADWHGQHPDFAIFLQEEEGYDAAGLDKLGRTLARLVGRQSTSTH